MVSAIQIIVDVYLPVAMNVISSAIEIVELADAERSDALHQATEKLLQRRRLRVEVHKDETLPGFHPDRNQTILRAIKVLHSLELRHAFERSVEAIFPTVVWTLQHHRLAAWLRHHRGGVMTAHVVESAKRAIASAHHNYRLSGQPRRDEFSRLLQLIGTSNQLPGPPEHTEPLQLCDARVDV